jgi:hypothetical protein
MNIIQARELAMQGKTVISPSGEEFDIEDFQEFDYPFSRPDIFGEWREKKEPRRLYAIFNEKGEIVSAGMPFRDDLMDCEPGERIVEFVEVL